MVDNVFVVGLNNAPHILSWERRFVRGAIKNFLSFLFLPRKPLFSKVPVCGNSVIIHIEQSEAFGNASRCEVIILTNILADEFLILMLRAEGLDIYADRLCHSNGVCNLNLRLGQHIRR